MAINKYQQTMWAEGIKTTNQTIPDVTSTVVNTFTTKIDLYNFFNSSTGKFTIPVAGLWNFSVMWSMSADTANWNHHSILNETAGTTVAASRTAYGPYIGSLSGMQVCAVGNLISFSIFMDTASGVTMNYCRFNAALLSGLPY
jgi:hypothetical protein